jgi:hypothetical protein
MRDPELRGDRAAAATERVRDFAIDRAVQRQQELYESLTAHQR